MAKFVKTSAVVALILLIVLAFELWMQSSGAPQHRQISLRVDRWRICGDWYEYRAFSSDSGPLPVGPGALSVDSHSRLFRSGTDVGWCAVTGWRNPSTITMAYESGPLKGTVLKGVCKFVRDSRTLVICVGDPPPTDFMIPRGSGRTLVVYRKWPYSPR
jgi:hypothetical protein